jgi:hypothetical protein
MDEQTFQVLHHYTERLTRDPDDRDELVLMAWMASKRMGERATIALMINVMKLRAREIKTRCAFGTAISGKSIRDAWNHDRVYLHAPVGRQSGFTLQDTLSCYSEDPLSVCVVNDFENGLGAEKGVADCIVAGYTQKETVCRLRISNHKFGEMKRRVQGKAVRYLT